MASPPAVAGIGVEAIGKAALHECASGHLKTKARRIIRDGLPEARWLR